MKKRILSLLLAVVMVITCSSVLAASAEEAIDRGVLTVGTPVTCTTLDDGDRVSYTFTVPEDGVYAFYSENSTNDPIAELYVGEEVIAGNDDGHNYRDFCIQAQLTKDTVYTLVCWTFNGSDSFEIYSVKVGLPTALKIEGDSVMYLPLTYELYALPIPAITLEDPIVLWGSSDPTVATVEDGYVTALKAGTVTITAKTASGVEGSITITVKKPDPIALNTPVTITEESYFTFTPAETDYYRFYSTNCGPTDPLIEVYDEEGYYWVEFDDSYANGIYSYNYSGILELKAGTTYTLKASSYSEELHHTLCIEKSAGIVEMSVVTPPAKTTYIKGHGEPDLTGLVVRLTFSDQTTADYSVSQMPYGGGLMLGNHELSVGFDFYEDGRIDLFCGDAELTIPVTLIDNPVASIEVESIAMDPFYYGYDAYYDMDHYIYDISTHLPTALTLKVTYTDTSSESIPCEWIDGSWFCDGYPISFSGSSQHTTPWVPGDENVMSLEWLGASADFFVSLKENNVDHLELIQAPSRVYSLSDSNFVHLEGDEYYFHDVDLSGLIFKIHYTDETSDTVTYDDLSPNHNTINGIGYSVFVEPVDEGTETVGGFSYLGKFFEFPVTVRPEMAYTDIAYDWAYDGISFCYNNNLMLGTDANTFAPKMVMTRAMAVTALWRLVGAPTDAAAASFTDVPANEWYTDAVNWAAAEGIVNGVGDNKFAPAREISRAEMVTLFFRFADYYGMDTSALADYSDFLDADDVPAWAEDGIAWAVGTNLVGGTASGNGYILMPAMEATREQAATLLMRFLYNA